jgi:hypothetical protein
MVNARKHSRFGDEDSELYAKELVGYHSSIAGKDSHTPAPAWRDAAPDS